MGWGRGEIGRGGCSGDPLTHFSLYRCRRGTGPSPGGGGPRRSSSTVPATVRPLSAAAITPRAAAAASSGAGPAPATAPAPPPSGQPPPGIPRPSPPPRCGDGGTGFGHRLLKRIRQQTGLCGGRSTPSPALSLQTLCYKKNPQNS